MTLQPQVLESQLATATATVQRLLAGEPALDDATAWRGLAERGADLRRLLRRFDAFHTERAALETQFTVAPAEQARQARARLDSFDAEWLRVWRRAARLAGLLMTLHRRLGAGPSSGWALAVQSLAIEVGEWPDPALVRTTVQRLATQPTAMVHGSDAIGSDSVADALFIALALAAVLLQRSGSHA